MARTCKLWLLFNFLVHFCIQMWLLSIQMLQGFGSLFFFFLEHSHYFINWRLHDHSPCSASLLSHSFTVKSQIWWNKSMETTVNKCYKLRKVSKIFAGSIKKKYNNSCTKGVSRNQGKLHLIKPESKGLWFV